MGGQYTTDGFGENAAATAVFQTGATPGDIVILCWNAITRLSMPVDPSPDNRALEVGSTGLYTWDSQFLTTQPLAFTQVVFTMTDARTGSVKVGKFNVGGFSDAIAIAQYDGAVHCDITGTAGTQPGVNGTPNNPVDTLADVLTLLATPQLIHLRTIRINGLLTVGAGQDISSLIIDGSNPEVDIVDHIATCVNLNTGYKRVNIRGVLAGEVQAEECTIGDSALNLTVQGLEGFFDNCSVGTGSGALRFAAGGDCAFRTRTTAADLAQPRTTLLNGTIFDLVDGPASVIIQKAANFFTVRNQTTGTFVIDLDSAQVEIEASCSAGIRVLTGPVGVVLDANTGGSTFREFVDPAIREHVLNRRRVNYSFSPAREEVFDDDGSTLLSAINKPGDAELFDEIGANVTTANRPAGTLISDRRPL